MVTDKKMSFAFIAGNIIGGILGIIAALLAVSILYLIL